MIIVREKEGKGAIKNLQKKKTLKKTEEQRKRTKEKNIKTENTSSVLKEEDINHYGKKKNHTKLSK